MRRTVPALIDPTPFVDGIGSTRAGILHYSLWITGLITSLSMTRHKREGSVIRSQPALKSPQVLMYCTGICDGLYFLLSFRWSKSSSDVGSRVRVLTHQICRVRSSHKRQPYVHQSLQGVPGSFRSHYTNLEFVSFSFLFRVPSSFLVPPTLRRGASGGGVTRTGQKKTKISTLTPPPTN
ncbi:hypothetical protein BGY98DRAFT_183616 [Russula aff. rugulosa BPL654]|nr:hypothetical protein BGY98DRAFT_183616 [Russula aff. rugulosa BPL654]